MSSAHVTDHKVYIEAYPEEEAIYVNVIHPENCLKIIHCYPVSHEDDLAYDAPPFGIKWSKTVGKSWNGHYEYMVSHPACIVQYEEVNVGLNADNVDYELREPDPEVKWRDTYNQKMLDYLFAHNWQEVPITVDVTYGWSTAGPWGDSEYDWEFSWAPTALIVDESNGVPDANHNST
jgi:hypothetical protein